MKKCNLVTIRQAECLKALGFNEPCGVYAIFLEKPRPLIMYAYPSKNEDWKDGISVPTVDEAIDWLRKKFNIVIHDKVDPFVDPTSMKITYIHQVKFCNTKHGWNFREFIYRGTPRTNVYVSKRICIQKALDYLFNTKRPCYKKEK